MTIALVFSSIIGAVLAIWLLGIIRQIIKEKLD